MPGGSNGAIIPGKWLDGVLSVPSSSPLHAQMPSPTFPLGTQCGGNSAYCRKTMWESVHRSPITPQLQGALTTLLILVPQVDNVTLCPLYSQRKVNWAGPGVAQDHTAEKRPLPTCRLGRKPCNPGNDYPSMVKPLIFGLSRTPTDSPHNSCLYYILGVAGAPH